MSRSRFQFWVAIIVLLLALPSCRHAAKPGTNASAENVSHDADLSRPFDISSWVGTGRTGEPLSLAAAMAQSAGGCWVVFAPKPLDEVKWTPAYTPQAQSVQQVLETCAKKSPIAWKQGKEYVLLYFGPEKELHAIEKSPPDGITGFGIFAETAGQMVTAMSSTWQIKIDADPQLLTLRQNLLGRETKPEEEGGGVLSLMYGEASRRSYSGAYSQQTHRAMLQFKVVDRIGLEELMVRLADYFGGEAAYKSGTWKLSRLTDPKKISDKIAALKAKIDGSPEISAEGFSSYAGRSGASPGAEVESPTEIPPLREETNDAFSTLGLFGDAAVPTLAGFLDVAKPPAADAALRVLEIMDLPTADAAIANFAKRAMHTTNPKQKGMAALLLSKCAAAIARKGTKAGMEALGEIATSPDASDEARATARQGLVATGNLTAFKSDSNGTIALGEFELPVFHGEKDAPTGTLSPVASNLSPDGNRWVVVVCPRLGNAMDLWLAREREGKWQEFLFSGKQYVAGSNYSSYGGGPKAGSCTISVDGDSVVLSPPNKTDALELQRVQAALRDSGLVAERRSELYRKSSKLQQSVSKGLRTPITLSLKEMRQDTDGDGLPDRIEKRLGSDPSKKDTDGDGAPDGKDANPLAPAPNGTEGKPLAGNADRREILQTVFTACFGGDKARDPIIVVLDKPSWQEFHGAAARVICVTEEDYMKRVDDLGGMRVLQFGGPANDSMTILTKDGPVLFNDSRSLAEVHYWSWRPMAGSQTYYSPYDMRGQMPKEYLAKFRQSGGWKLESSKPSKFGTADMAIAKIMMRQGQRYGGYAD